MRMGQRLNLDNRGQVDPKNLLCSPPHFIIRGRVAHLDGPEFQQVQSALSLLSFLSDRNGICFFPLWCFFRLCSSSLLLLSALLEGAAVLPLCFSQ